MRILVLGGTQFIGREVVLKLVARGHHVDVLNRGRSTDDLPAVVGRFRGDRDLGDAGLAALPPTRWDACIDVSGYTGVHVRASAERLQNAADRYVFISAVATYGEHAAAPVIESHPRVEPAPESETRVEGALYGRLKVTCENIVGDVFRGRSLVLRPQVVVGPGDPTGRYTYWLSRALRPGPMLVPGDGTDHVQVVDVADLAAFAVHGVEGRLTGTFNVAGPRITWRTFVEMLQEEITPPPDVRWVPASVLERAGVGEFELPLYRRAGSPRAPWMDISTAAAGAAGYCQTSARDTLRRTLAWVRAINVELALPPHREAALLAAARA